MNYVGTPLPGVVIIDRKLFRDHRGYFTESYKTSADNMRGMFRQLNTAQSTKNVLRGMHRQDQTKLVMPVYGTIFDVALDPETGQWFGAELDNSKAMFIPPQYAHGYLALSELSIVQYIVDAPYNRDAEETFAWDKYGIEWPITGNPILSDKDDLHL